MYTLPRHPEFRTRDHAARRQLLCDVRTLLSWPCAAAHVDATLCVQLARQHLTELEELKARIDAA
jgi:hypothetical protein